MSEEPKKSKIKNLAKNFGVKQRVFVAIMIAFSGLTIAGTLSLFSPGESEIDDKAEKSQTRIGANSSDVKESKVGEELNYDPDSPKAEKVKKAREQKINEAESEDGKGYMDPLNISSSSNSATSEKEKVDPLDQLIEGTQRDAEKELGEELSKQTRETGLSDVTNNVEKQKEEQSRRVKEISDSLNNGGNSRLPGTQYQYRHRFTDAMTQKFIDEELKDIDEMKSRISRDVSEMEDPSYSYNSGGADSSDIAKGSRASDSSQESDSYNGDPYFAEVTRDRTQDAQPDIATSNRIGRMVDSQLNGAMSTNAGQIGGFGRTSSDDQNRKSSPSSGGSPRGPQSPGRMAASASTTDAKPYKTVGDVCYGQLNMPVNTDAVTPVKATILDYNCGELRNSVLVSKKPERIGEWVSLNFEVMKHDGRAKSVNAIALDPKSKAGFLADDVNRHIISRYVSLALAAGLPGWADSVQNEERVEEDNGDERVITEAVSGTDQLAVITGAIADEITPAVKQNFNRPPTVKLFDGRPILIMFMGDVFLN